MATEQIKESKVEIPEIEVPKTETTKNKTEDEILFPELEIDGYIIKPWTLGKLRKVNPHIEKVLETLKNKKVQLSTENIESHIMDVYFAAIPEMISILAISLDKEEEDLEDIPIPQAIKLVYLVYRQNEDSIKNVFSLLQMTRQKA
jgi:hypothetical protein